MDISHLASDDDGDPITGYAITGGNDDGYFEIVKERLVQKVDDQDEPVVEDGLPVYETETGFGIYISYETLPDLPVGGSRYPATYELALTATSENAAGETQTSEAFTVELELTSPYDILDAREVLAENPEGLLDSNSHALNINEAYVSETYDTGTNRYEQFVDPDNYVVVIDHDGGAILDKDGNVIPSLEIEKSQSITGEKTTVTVSEITQNSDITMTSGDYGESGSLILAKGGTDTINLHKQKLVRIPSFIMWRQMATWLLWMVLMISITSIWVLIASSSWIPIMIVQIPPRWRI